MITANLRPLRSILNIAMGLSLAFALALSVGPAMAAEPTAPDKTTAEQLVAEGRALRDAGQLRDALGRYKVAFALHATPTTGLELAETHEALNELVEAEAVLQAVSSAPASTSDSPRTAAARTSCSQLATRIASRVATLTVSPNGARDGGKVSIWLNGIMLPSESAGTPRRVNPGAYEIAVADGEGGQRTQTNVVLSEGESRTVRLAVAVAKPGPGAQSEQAATPRDAELSRHEKQDAAEAQKTLKEQTEAGVERAHERDARSPVVVAGNGEFIHDSFYFRGGLGVGALAGAIESGAVAADFSGVAVMVDLSAGWTTWRGVVLGAGVFSGYAPSVSVPSGADTSVSTTVLGPMVDWYPNPNGGVHFLGALGLGMTNFTISGASELGSSGVGIVLGSGYSTWISPKWSVGGDLLILHASTSGDDDGYDTDLSSTVVGLVGSFTLN